MFNQVRPDDGQVNMLTGEGGDPGRAHAPRGRHRARGRAGERTGDAGPRGRPGRTIEIGQEFDGWGYAHLFDAKTGEELDAYAISEARDPRFADGFGDLSIHEFATDPKTNLAYAAYYAGGIRVFGFSREDGLDEVGAWIADGGSNFWGVEQFTRRQRRAADRRVGSRLRSRDPALHRGRAPSGRLRPRPRVGATRRSRRQRRRAAGSTPPAAKTATIRKRAITVGKNRRFKVAVNCPATANGRCAGTLRAERGRTILANKAFSVTADRLRNVTIRLKKADYRALRRSRNGRMVTFTLTTRDAAGTLRQTSAKVRLRAKR